MGERHHGILSTNIEHSNAKSKQYLSTLVQSCKIHGLLAVFMTLSNDAGLKYAGNNFDCP